MAVLRPVRLTTVVPAATFVQLVSPEGALYLYHHCAVWLRNVMVAVAACTALAAKYTSLSASVATTRAPEAPEYAVSVLVTAWVSVLVPLTASASSSAGTVTVWAVLQFAAVNVSVLW